MRASSSRQVHSAVGAGATAPPTRLRATRSNRPEQLTDDEIADIVRAAIAETGADGPRAMGAVTKVVQPKVAGRVEGGRVAAAFDHCQPVRGAISTRPRTDHNPLSRREYLLHVVRRV